LIKFTIDLKGIKELDKTLMELERVLENLIPYGKQVQKTVEAAMIDRFDYFDSRTDNDPVYFKRKGYKPVGVLTGDLRNAIVNGHGSINELFKTPDGFSLVCGINETAFRNNYPIYFRKWLKKHAGVELVALEDHQAESIADSVFSEIILDIERIMAGGVG
jgi:hypothetical protein